MKRVKYSRDGVVEFESESHVYTNKNTGKRLVSNTQFCSQFFPVFDTQSEAAKYATKNGLDKDDVVASWKKVADDGTFIHLVFETFDVFGFDCFQKGITQADKIRQIEFLAGKYPKVGGAVKFIKDWILTGEIVPLDREVIVYDNNTAGQIDMIAKTASGQTITLDWKTNKAISTYYKEYMSEPFSAYPANTLNKYFMQQVMYKSMMSKMDMYKGITVAAQYLVHITKNDYRIIRVNNNHLINDVMNYNFNR